MQPPSTLLSLRFNDSMRNSPRVRISQSHRALQVQMHKNTTKLTLFERMMDFCSASKITAFILIIISVAPSALLVKTFQQIAADRVQRANLATDRH